MSRFTDATQVSVQVESARADAWVPDGIALPQRNYDDGGLVFDARKGLAFAPETFLRDDATRTARTFTANKTSWVVDVSSSGNAQHAAEIGSVIAQTSIALPVSEGMRVNWSGRWRQRQTGYNGRDENNDLTPINIRAAIWAVGVTTDEYGTETKLTTELMTYQAQLQGNAIGIPPQNYVSFQLPVVSDAVVPPGYDRIYLTFTTYAASTGNILKPKYRAFTWFQNDTDFFSVFKDDPLRLYLKRAPGVVATEANPLSNTGYSFPSRRVFTNVPPAARAVLVAAPGATGPVTVTVHAYDGTSPGGPLLSTLTVLPGQRVTVDVSTPTGKLYLDGSGPWGVERVTAAEYDILTEEQTTLCRFTYQDILDDVNTVTTESIEADMAVTKIRFVTETPSPLIAIGKRLRVVGLHGDGGHTVIFTGTIRARRTVVDSNDKPVIEVTVHTSYGRIGQLDCPAAYDQLSEYSQLLGCVGASVSIDSVDVSGPAKPLPNGWDYFPSYSDDAMTLTDSLIMARNARKAFLFTDRRDHTRVLTELPETPVIDLTDQPGQGDMSYTRQIEYGSDSAGIVNAVEVVEHLLDRESFTDRSLDASDNPPIDLAYIESKSRRVEYRRPESIELYGTQRKTFNVVRGSGSWEDLNADRYGPPFQSWAADILDTYAVESTDVNRISLTVTERHHIALVSSLQPLDAVVVRYRGTAWVRRIRRVEHTIRPNKWTVAVRFDAQSDQVLWLPDTPVPLIVLGDTDAATLADPSKGLVDGRHPSEPDVYQLDGGTL